MEKRYFIKEVERILTVKRASLFYWERTGKIPKAKRTPMGNYRYWTEEDIKKLKKIIGR